MKNKEKPKVIWICNFEDILHIAIDISIILMVLSVTALAIAGTIVAVRKML